MQFLGMPECQFLSDHRLPALSQPESRIPAIGTPGSQRGDGGQFNVCDDQARPMNCRFGAFSPTTGSDAPNHARAQHVALRFCLVKALPVIEKHERDVLSIYSNRGSSARCSISEYKSGFLQATSKRVHFFNVNCTAVTFP